MKLLFLLVVISLSSLSSSEGNPNLLPRPLIIELPSASSEDTQLRCDSWRFLAEANNLAPWKTVPLECGDYVKDYMMVRGYRYDVEMVMMEALEYARSVEMVGDGKDAWVFDVDETLLSNLPYYVDHGFGLELFNGQEFDKWVAKAIAPAIESSLKFYEEVLGLGFKIFLLTGRTEGQRSITTDNLNIVGFRDWEKLILREEKQESFQRQDMKKSCDKRRSKKVQPMNNCKQSHGHIHKEHNYPRSVKFCKILVGDFSGRMSIPIKLVGWFQENLAEIIDLKGPSGSKWHVGLGKNTTGSVFFQYGWKEFVEDHYLEENDILIFKYKGDSSFSVSIFDSNECERESCYFSKNAHLEKQESAEEYSIKTVEESTTAARKSYHCISRGIHNVDDILKKSSPSDKDEREEFVCSEKREDIASSKPEVAGARSLGNQSESRNLPRRLPTAAEKDDAIHLARAFTPSRPSFLTVMKGYNVCAQFQLLIPPDFAREFLPQESQDIILQVTNARNEWKVKYGVGESSSRFLGKWRSFVRENNLKVGDVCVFELSRERKRIAMMVHIFRAH